jgi:MFS family permease
MWFVYIIQIIYGFAGALIYPTWRVIFTRYSHKERAGYEWGIYDTLTSLSTAAAATIGGVLIEQISFRALFVIVSILSFVGTYFLIRIFKQEFTCKIDLTCAENGAFFFRLAIIFRHS